jgi:anti-sigma B factor antagonist
MAAIINFQEVSQGNWIILKAIGRIDTTNASVAEKALSASLEKTKNLALDMSQLEYTSSAGLRVMLRIGKKAKKDHKQFVFCGVSGMVKEILEDSGTDLLFTIYGSAAELK